MVSDYIHDDVIREMIGRKFCKRLCPEPFLFNAHGERKHFLFVNFISPSCAVSHKLSEAFPISFQLLLVGLSEEDICS